MNTWVVTAVLLLLGAAAALFALRKPKVVETVKEDKPEVVKEPKKPEKKEKQAKKRVVVKAEPHLETAEKVINVGASLPLCIAFDPDNRYFIVPTKNRQQLLYSVDSIETGKNPVQRYKSVQDDIVDANLLGGSTLTAVYAVDRERRVVSFDLKPSSPNTVQGKIFTSSIQGFTIDKIRAANDRSYVAVLGDKTHIKLLQPSGGNIYSTDTRQMQNTEISMSADSQFVGVSSYTSDIVVYGTSKEEGETPTKFNRAFTLSNHKNSIQTLDFHKTEPIVATGGRDGKINVSRIPSLWKEGSDIPKVIRTGFLPDNQPIKKIRMSPVSSMIAILTEDGELVFWDDEVKKRVERPHTHPITHMEWTRDGKWVAVMSTSSPFIYFYSPEASK